MTIEDSPPQTQLPQEPFADTYVDTQVVPAPAPRSPDGQPNGLWAEDDDDVEALQSIIDDAQRSGPSPPVLDNLEDSKNDLETLEQIINEQQAQATSSDSTAQSVASKTLSVCLGFQ